MYFLKYNFSLLKKAVDVLCILHNSEREDTMFFGKFNPELWKIHVLIVYNYRTPVQNGKIHEP